MATYYVAVTYDVCIHNDLHEDMNEYPIEDSSNLEEQVKDFARQDIAPVVRVYQSSSDGTGKLTLYKEYHFKEYECSCTN